jgi:YD repeat-containing protein
MAFQYDDRDRVVLAWDDVGRWQTYAYDVHGGLAKTLDAAGNVREYEYDDHARMTLAHNGRTIDTMAYDSEGRCVRFERRLEAYVDGAGHAFERRQTLQFAYTIDVGGTMARQVMVTGEDGTRTVTFDERGYTLVDSYAPGSPAEQRTAIERDSRTNVARRVNVTCRVGDVPAHAAEEIHQGQNEYAIVARVRRACDVEAAHASSLR